MTPEELKQWRETEGYSQVQLAQALGIHERTISSWEIGRRSIPPLLQWALYGLMADSAAKRTRDTIKAMAGSDNAK